jgi:hypothetical protein
MTGVIATDNTQIQPTGWAYTITVLSSTGRTIVGPFNTFITYANGTTQDLSTLTPALNVTSMQGYLPLPSGIPVSGNVPVATGTGNTTEWQTPYDAAGAASAAQTAAETYAAGIVIPLSTNVDFPSGVGPFNDVGVGGASARWDHAHALAAINGMASIQIRGRAATTGAPTTGTWSTGDTILDSAGVWHYCTAGGTPGTWA